MSGRLNCNFSIVADTSPLIGMDCGVGVNEFVVVGVNEFVVVGVNEFVVFVNEFVDT
jgi:hypothetical protein